MRKFTICSLSLAAGVIISTLSSGAAWALTAPGSLFARPPAAARLQRAAWQDRWGNVHFDQSHRGVYDGHRR